MDSTLKTAATIRRQKRQHQFNAKAERRTGKQYIIELQRCISPNSPMQDTHITYVIKNPQAADNIERQKLYRSANSTIYETKRNVASRDKHVPTAQHSTNAIRDEIRMRHAPALRDTGLKNDMANEPKRISNDSMHAPIVVFKSVRAHNPHRTRSKHKAKT